MHKEDLAFGTSHFKENDMLELKFNIEDALSGIDTLKIKLNDVEYNWGNKILIFMNLSVFARN